MITRVFGGYNSMSDLTFCFYCIFGPSGKAASNP
jgi:hypothetical protein